MELLVTLDSRGHRDLPALQDHKVPQEIWDQLAVLVNQETQDLMEQPDRRDRPEIQDPLEHLEPQVSLVLWDKQDLQVLKVRQDHLARKVTPVRQEMQGLQVLRDNLVRLEMLERLARQEMPDQPDPKGRKDLKEIRVQLDCRARQEHPELMDSQEALVYQELWDRLEIRDKQALQEHQDPTAHLETLALKVKLELPVEEANLELVEQLDSPDRLVRKETPEAQVQSDPLGTWGNPDLWAMLVSRARVGNLAVQVSQVSQERKERVDLLGP